MLVVTSNWCVPDGSLSGGPGPGLVARFRAEVRRASLRHGFRGDGTYRPVSGIAIVFAGDTFDWLTSREWTGDVRPWAASRRADAARQRVAAGSLRLARRLIATLAAWGRHGLDVPDADRRGRPRPDACRRVPVRVAILRGDRDRWIESIGSAAAATAAASVGRCWADGYVTVRHGEEIESLWHGGGPEPTIGESLAVELVARFGCGLDDVSGLRHQTAVVMRMLAAGRLVDAPSRLAAWLAARERDRAISSSQRTAFIDAWNRAVACWHRAVRRLDVGHVEGVELAERLAAWMTLTARAVDDVRADIHGHGWGDVPAAWPSDACGRCEILGHPPVGFVVPPSWHRRVLCIGPSSVEPAAAAHARAGGAAGLALFDPPGMIHCGGGADEPPLPNAAVVQVAAAGPWLEWLPIGGSAPLSNDRQEGAGGRGIWRSQPAGPESRIVDAA